MINKKDIFEHMSHKGKDCIKVIFPYDPIIIKIVKTSNLQDGACRINAGILLIIIVILKQLRLNWDCYSNSLHSNRRY